MDVSTFYKFVLKSISIKNVRTIAILLFCSIINSDDYVRHRENIL